MYGGTLIGNGSFGCVFNPLIPCNSKSNLKGNKVSKIFFGNESKNDADVEYELSKNINKIDPEKKWSYTWESKCKSPKYSLILKKEKGITKCLQDANIDIERFDRTSYMLTGDYAGKVINDTRESSELQKCYTNSNAFWKIFLKIMKSVKPLFLGLKELYKHKISHLDINRNNMTMELEDKLFRYIDFGLSCKFTDTEKYENRSKSEFGWERIYPPYPLEYIYLFAPKELLEEEEYDIKMGIYRTGFDTFVSIHEVIFGRKDIKKYQESIIKQMKNRQNANKKQILSSIDTYSLGIFIARMILENKPDNISKSKLRNLLNDPIIKDFIDLFGLMSEPDSSKRIKPEEAYDKYLILEKEHIF